MGIEQALKDFASSNAGKGALTGAGIGGVGNALRAYLTGDSALEGGLTGAALGGLVGGGFGYNSDLREADKLENEKLREALKTNVNNNKSVPATPTPTSNTPTNVKITNLYEQLERAKQMEKDKIRRDKITTALAGAGVGAAGGGYLGRKMLGKGYGRYGALIGGILGLTN
jgi:hypothetical protein